MTILDTLEARVGHPLPAIRAAIGEPVVEAERIDRSIPDVPDRATHRLATASGRTLKLRWVGPAIDAAWVERVLAALDDPRAARVLCREGRCLLEEWIPGEPAPVPPTEAVLTEAGAFLGRLHALEQVDGERVVEDRRARRDRHRVERHLDDLVEADLMSRAEGRALRRAAGVATPRRARLGLVHRDLGGPNIIIDERGRVCFIDNESVGRGVLDFDLYDVLASWELSEQAERLFLGAYWTEREPPDGEPHEMFWRIATHARSLHREHEGRAGGGPWSAFRHDVARNQLRRLAGALDR